MLNASLVRTRAALACTAIAILTACGGGATHFTPPGANPTPIPKSSATPAPKPSMTATPTATPVAQTGMAAIIAAAFGDAQAYYASLPHMSRANDLSATAAHMVSSGKFTTAVVGKGGITGTLPGGLQGVLFADRPEETGPTAMKAAPVHVSTGGREMPVLDARYASINGTLPHEMIFFVNTTDHGGAFVPSRQGDLASALTTALGSSANTYEVAALAITLENIQFLSGAKLDFLSLATHGMVALVGSNNTPKYLNLSDTAVTENSLATYDTEISSGLVYPAAVLVNSTSASSFATFAFSPAYMAAHLHFNVGSLFDNESCYGQEPSANQPTFTYLSGAGVGTYLGWTEPVGGNYADQTDSFLVDRMFGEVASSPIAGYVDQRPHLQRAFVLADVLNAMTAESRSGQLLTSPQNYTYSPPDPPDGQADLQATTNQQVDDALIVPSISTMTVTEGTPSTLKISGEFPAAQGTVSVLGSAGERALGVMSWAPDAIVVALPDSSSDSAGLINVTSALGVDSNSVPLTSWHGTFKYVEQATLTQFGSVQGSGIGTLDMAFDLAIRSDVDKVVPTIDASPEPQNLYIANVTPGSTGTITKYTGSFRSSDGTQTAAIAQTGNGALTPFGASNNFQFNSMLDAVNKAPCNNGMPGPQGMLGNVACPGFAFAATGAATCTDNQNGSFCATALANGARIGMPSSSFGDDQDYNSTPSSLTFTMDPTSFAITVTSTQGTEYNQNFSEFSQATENMTGSFTAPLEPPTGQFRRRSSKAATFGLHT